MANTPKYQMPAEVEVEPIVEALDEEQFSFILNGIENCKLTFFWPKCSASVLALFHLYHRFANGFVHTAGNLCSCVAVVGQLDAGPGHPDWLPWNYIVSHLKHAGQCKCGTKAQTLTPVWDLIKWPVFICGKHFLTPPIPKKTIGCQSHPQTALNLIACIYC